MTLWLVLMACRPNEATPTPQEVSLEIASLQGQTLESMGSVVVVQWQQDVASSARATYTLPGEAERTTPVVAAVAGENSLPLLGIPFAAEVTWSLTLIADDGTEVTSESSTTTTAALPDGVPEVTAVTGDAAAYDADARFFLTSMNGTGGGGARAWTFIIDRLGRVVWALEGPQQRATLHPRLSYDGTDILIDHNSFWGIFDGGEASQVVRVGLDGVVQETIDTLHLHHPFVELADGSLVWGASTGFYADEALRKRTPDGQVSDLWSCEDLLDELDVDDYCGSNTIYWDEEEDTFLFSLYSVEAVIEIDHATGETLHTWGHLPGSWAFEPVASAFWWQHGPVITDEGTLLISSKVSEDGAETVVREYAIDDDSETLIEVWSFGEGEGIYGSEMGEAHRLVGGNTLHNYGSTPRLREATPEGAVVWDVAWGQGTYIGRSEPLADLYALWP